MSHIGLMGTHGTGKTTYAKRLMKQTFRHTTLIRMISEVARSCPYPVNQTTSEEAQLWIFHRQMLEEIEAQADPSRFIICDRTVLDSLAYAEHAGLADVVDACMPMALNWIERYTQILWFRPVPGRLVEDGFRDTDPDFQKSIDRIFATWIHDYHIPVEEVTPCFTVHSQTVEQPTPRNDNYGPLY